MSSPGYSRVSSRNVRPFGPAVWPATGNMYWRFLFYYIDIIECRVYINKTKPGAATRWVYFYRFYCHIGVLFNIQLTQYLSDLGLQEAAIWGSMLDSLSDLQLIWFDNLCVSVCLSIYISIYLYLSISIFLYLSFCIYLSIYIYVSISIDLYPSI